MGQGEEPFALTRSIATVPRGMQGSVPAFCCVLPLFPAPDVFPQEQMPTVGEFRCLVQEAGAAEPKIVVVFGSAFGMLSSLWGAIQQGPGCCSAPPSGAGSTCLCKGPLPWEGVHGGGVLKPQDSVGCVVRAEPQAGPGCAALLLSQHHQRAGGIGAGGSSSRHCPGFSSQLHIEHLLCASLTHGTLALCPWDVPN